MDNDYDGTVWAFQVISKEDSYPSTIQTIFFDRKADILDATAALYDEIYEYLINKGHELRFLDSPENLLHYLNKTNDRSTSIFVVRIYPPNDRNLQKKY